MPIISNFPSGNTKDIQTNLTNHENDTVKHITAAERTAWNGKAAGNHNHDGTYLKTETDPTVPAWAKAASKPAYTAAEVGADPAGSAAGVQSGLDAHTGNKANPHGVTAEQVGAVPTGGTTMTGALKAMSNAAVGTAQMRNIYAGTADMTAGSTSLATGTIYLMYE